MPHIWRDTWEDMPNVVIISETPITAQGVLEDALLFVFDGIQLAEASEKGGEMASFEVPSAALAGMYFCAGVDMNIRSKQ